MSLHVPLAHIERHPELMRVNAGVAMSYERIENDDESALPLPLQGLTVASILPSEPPASTSQRDYAACCLALVFLAFRELDRAHNLITPLSWQSYTAYGGPPVIGSAAAKEAAYIHAMIHRAEGEVEGEFGTGFSNSVYWSRVAGEGLPFSAKLLDCAKRFSSLEKVTMKGSFDQGNFVYVIRQALERKDDELISVCSKVVEREWWLMMEHCLEATNCKGTWRR